MLVLEYWDNLNDLPLPRYGERKTLGWTNKRDIKSIQKEGEGDKDTLSALIARRISSP
jgi:hypothetical protein